MADTTDSPLRSIMVVGGGSPRDHALVRSLRASPRVGRLLFVPGNSAVEQLEGVATYPCASQDLAGLVEVAEMEEIDLTVIGPNTPLISGVVDRFRAHDLAIVGSAAHAARLEGSKAFAKNFMISRDIPTARFAVYEDTERATHLCKRAGWARVIKTDGLAYEKGVEVCYTAAQCEESIQRIMVDEVLDPDGEARVVIEERLEGPEVTLCVLSDGHDVVTLGACRNYPRLLDHDAGPRTRGMGAVSPTRHVPPALLAEMEERIVLPAVRGLADNGPPLIGALFVDVIIQRGIPYVLDFNVRFGDPATQVILARQRTDLFTLLEACVEGRLGELSAALTHDDRTAVSITLSAAGYPFERRRDDPITLDPRLFSTEGVFLDVGEMREGPEGVLLTTGGRTATVTALGDDLEDATRRAYEAARWVRYDGVHMRGDIGSGDPFV